MCPGATFIAKIAGAGPPAAIQTGAVVSEGANGVIGADQAGRRRGRGAGQPMSRRRRAARAVAARPKATATSQISGVAVTGAPGSLGTWVNGEMS